MNLNQQSIEIGNQEVSQDRVRRRVIEFEWSLNGPAYLTDFNQCLNWASIPKQESSTQRGTGSDDPRHATASRDPP